MFESFETLGDRAFQVEEVLELLRGEGQGAEGGGEQVDQQEEALVRGCVHCSKFCSKFLHGKL